VWIEVPSGIYYDRDECSRCGFDLKDRDPDLVGTFLTRDELGRLGVSMEEEANG
jgi:hypothetical protein